MSAMRVIGDFNKNSKKSCGSGGYGNQGQGEWVWRDRWREESETEIVDNSLEEVCCQGEQNMGWYLVGFNIDIEISITSDMQMTPPLWQKVKRNSKAS